VELLVTVVSSLQTKGLQMAEDGLSPVKRTASHVNVWDDLSHRLPHCTFKVTHDCLHVQVMTGVTDAVADRLNASITLNKYRLQALDCTFNVRCTEVFHHLKQNE